MKGVLGRPETEDPSDLSDSGTVAGQGWLQEAKPTSGSGTAALSMQRPCCLFTRGSYLAEGLGPASQACLDIWMLLTCGLVVPFLPSYKVRVSLFTFSCVASSTVGNRCFLEVQETS